MIRKRSKSIFQIIWKHYGRARKQTEQRKSILTEKKEVLAQKDRMEHGIQVNDNTMAELANLCDYLKLDFSSYFKDYQLQRDSKFFYRKLLSAELIIKSAGMAWKHVDLRFFYFFATTAMKISV